ncbi:unnamed protein product [Prorocentrum cordatum]|uniref:GNAT family N-acetyltransferase n=1 Tax=Prorocentrum cordatum TaxID=2364126 RepID=A0ABN9YAA8_9DINO|nr:unnamed protein product [Polarella glacialis]
MRRIDSFEQPERSNEVHCDVARSSDFSLVSYHSVIARRCRLHFGNFSNADAESPGLRILTVWNDRYRGRGSAMATVWCVDWLEDWRRHRLGQAGASAVYQCTSSAQPVGRDVGPSFGAA